MLENHNHPTVNAPTQCLRSMGLALVDASEHVLATAKHFLHSAPAVELEVARHPLARPAGSGGGDAGHFDAICEAIVESDW